MVGEGKGDSKDWEEEGKALQVVENEDGKNNGKQW